MNMGKNTYYVSYFIDELYQNGLENVVISPGSRSTPLAMTFAEHPDIKEWVHFDERSSAFFALGMAKKLKKPVALVCTSGTAAANYYPAIVEAYYSRVPLIVLTADRPHELRDNGSPQSIDQIKMYGNYTKYFHEMAVPDHTEVMLKYARRQASRAYAMANSSNQGPIHLNFPFKDPLVPDLTLSNLWGNSTQTYIEHVQGKEQITDQQVQHMLQLINDRKKGIIVCGELPNRKARDLVLTLANQWKIPVFADVLSNLRQAEATNRYIISSYDAILKQPEIREQLSVDYIIRFGSMPVSKPYMQWLSTQKPDVHIVVDENIGYREPANLETTMVYSDASSLIEKLLESENQPNVDPSWTSFWVENDQKAMKILKQHDEQLTEGTAVLALSEAVANGDTVFVGSSMPIRDMDTFFMTANQEVEVMANRGANGIDGVISSAIGVASTRSPVTLVIGDLSFLHDYTALFIARQQEIPLRILVINNNGGGIFSFLPQYSEKKHFEAVFGTPFDAPIESMAKAIGLDYYQPESYQELIEHLKKPVSSLELIEIQTNRDENLKWHRQKWDEVYQAIKRDVDS